MELPQYTLPILNASMVDVKIGINSQRFTFPKRSVTQIPYHLAPIIDNEYRQFGLSVIQNASEMEEKERSALTEYVGQLEFQIAARRAAIEEMRKAGRTIDEFNKDQILLNREMQWRKEIYVILNKEAPAEEVASFATDRAPILFNGMMETEVVVPEVSNPSSGSFAEIGLAAAERIKSNEQLFKE